MTFDIVFLLSRLFFQGHFGIKVKYVVLSVRTLTREIWHVVLIVCTITREICHVIPYCVYLPREVCHVVLIVCTITRKLWHNNQKSLFC